MNSPASRAAWRRVLALAACVLALPACTNIGPGTIKRDRFDYNSAISESWKQQTLLNIVKIRYADMPVFVQVASVVSGYQVEGSLNAGGTASSDGAVQGDFLNFGAAGKYIDRPTITYQPITGAEFNLSFMTPIPPRAILFLLQTGWSAELVLPLTVDSMNGLRPEVAAGARRREGDAGFYRLVELLSALQRSGAVGMQVRKSGNTDTTVLFFYKEAIAPEDRSAAEEVSRLLGLEPGAEEISVIYGQVPRNRREIAMATRSMLHIMIDLAGRVDVPPEDIEEGRTVPAIRMPQGEQSPIHVRYGDEKPESAFVAARYRDRWFWIDDRDFRSKRTFTFLMILFSLTESGEGQGLPLVTIPAG